MLIPPRRLPQCWHYVIKELAYVGDLAIGAEEDLMSRRIAAREQGLDVSSLLSGCPSGQRASANVLDV